MLLASILSVVALVAVVVVTYLEQRHSDDMRGGVAAAATPRTFEELAGQPFPRVLSGYDPTAVRDTLDRMAAALTVLAARADPEDVRAAGRAAGLPEEPEVALGDGSGDGVADGPTATTEGMHHAE